MTNQTKNARIVRGGRPAKKGTNGAKHNRRRANRAIKGKSRSKQCAIYARSANGTASCDTLKGQISECKLHSTRIGFKKATVYADRASGASLQNRDSLLELIRDAELGKLGTIVVSDIARISRNERDIQLFLHRMRSHRVKVYSIADGMFVDELTYAHDCMPFRSGYWINAGAVANGR